MKSETPAHRYRREAAECDVNAEKATNGVDREAWQRLAEDWTKLARSRLSAVQRPFAPNSPSLLERLQIVVGAH
jgi:hypothetical protein